METYNFHSIASRRSLDFWKLLDGDLVQKLSRHPLIDIGAHGHGHFLLDKIDIEAAKDDMTLCKSVLENLLDSPVDTFAFPAGSYSKEIKSLAVSCGYSKLLAERYRLPEDAGDPRIAERITISGTTNYYSNILHYHSNLRSASLRR